jgi:hypothetical protein
MNKLEDKSADIKIGKKIAIVVGIDEYDDKDIPKLEGAEYDAKELFELLTSEAGGFVNEEKNLLINKQARQRDILDRISEVFRQDKEFDIALFYFSGHGFVDKKEDLYLSTCDVKKKDPYVGGIKVDDLRDQIYSSENKRNAIMVLDCCYSGIATEGTRGDGSDTIKDLKPLLDRNIGNIKDKNYGTGKFTISSSAIDQVSYEKKDCTHVGDDREPHTHGEFTYYLLEGIRGGAEDENTGEITLLSLQQYINQKLVEKKKQNSYINISEGSNLNAITIALSLNKFNGYITSLENTIKTYFPEGDSSFPSFKKIRQGAIKLKEMKSKRPDNPNIFSFGDLLRSKLNNYKKGVLNWCTRLPDDVQIKIESITDTDSVAIFRNTVTKLDLESVITSGAKIFPILNVIDMEVKNDVSYVDDKDPNLMNFLQQLDPAYKLYKSMIGTMS